MGNKQHSLISVILPVYNGGRELATSIESILSQTYSHFELLISLDGCTDNSEKIIKKYSDNRIKLFNYQNNVGLGCNLNRLIFHTSKDTEYIAIAEQDDYYYPNRLELQVEYLIENQAKGMVSGIAEFYDGKKVSFLFPGLLASGKTYPIGKDMFLLNYMNQTKVVNSCMMFRKKTHIDNGLYFTTHHPNIAIDWAYYLRFSLVSQIGGLNEILVRLDRRPERNSITKNRTNYNAAARELLKNFKYEFPNIISRKHYRYALNTQRLIELGHYAGVLFILYITLYIFTNPFEKRYYYYLIKRVKRFFRETDDII